MFMGPLPPFLRAEKLQCEDEFPRLSPQVVTVAAVFGEKRPWAWPKVGQSSGDQLVDITGRALETRTQQTNEISICMWQTDGLFVVQPKPRHNSYKFFRCFGLFSFKSDDFAILNYFPMGSIIFSHTHNPCARACVQWTNDHHFVIRLVFLWHVRPSLVCRHPRQFHYVVCN